MKSTFTSNSLAYLTGALIVLALVAEVTKTGILGFSGTQFAFAAVEFGFLSAAYLLRIGITSKDPCPPCPPYCPAIVHVALALAIASVVAEVVVADKPASNLPFVCAALSIALSVVSASAFAYCRGVKRE